MDFSHLKHSEMAVHLHQYKGRAVLRRDVVKDDIGGHALFIEQGTAASHITAAKVLDNQCGTRCADL